jgi:hypothetical protein
LKLTIATKFFVKQGDGGEKGEATGGRSEIKKVYCFRDLAKLNERETFLWLFSVELIVMFVRFSFQSWQLIDSMMGID